MYSRKCSICTKRKQGVALKEKEKEKKKKKNKAKIIIITKWLKACFLGNVGVIWCNSLSDSHFKLVWWIMYKFWLIAIYILPYMYLMLLLVAHTSQVILC